MSQPLRIEDKNRKSLITTRTQRSELWFVMNRDLQRKILGFLAKIQKRHNVEIYAFVILGNHYHLVARFLLQNRSAFMRDFNSVIPKLLKAANPDYDGGSLWERRYGEQGLPLDEDLEDYFFYCALQAVSSGLCERIGDYPGYNSFNNAINGIEEKYSLINWSKYRRAKRRNKNVSVNDFAETFTLRFTPLPNYAHLSKKEYRNTLHQKLEERRLQIVKRKLAEGYRYPSPEFLSETVAGSKPRSTQKSNRDSYRPLVLTRSAEAKKHFLSNYFAIFQAYKKASIDFLKGKADAIFPPNTYKPPMCFNSA
jgi:hypothetical protein